MDPFLALAHHAPNAANFERFALEHLARSVGFDVAFFAVRGRTPTTIALDVECIDRALAPDSPYEAELRPVKQAALSARGVATDTDVLGASRVNAAYFRELAVPVGGRHSMMAYLVLRGDLIGAVMLGRVGSEFGARDVERVASLLPGLAVARASFGGAAFVPRAIERSRDDVVALRAKPYGELVVRDRNGQREMVARDVANETEAIWSRAHLAEPRRSGWPYVDLFRVASALASRCERALFVGCGGGVAALQFAGAHPGIHIDIVDDDADVIALARRHFGLDSVPDLATYVDDGAAFVARTPARTWDIIIVDAYGASLDAPRIPAHFFSHTRGALRPRGAIAWNVIDTLDGDVVREVIDRAERALDEVRVVPVMGGEPFDVSARRNVIVLGVRHR